MSSPDPPSRQAAFADPRIALRPGRRDAVIVLVLWAARRSFVPLLLLGLIGGWITGRLQTQEPLSAFDTVGELLGALLSPLAGIAAALLIRLSIGWFALLAAWPLARWEPEPGRTFTQRWHDLYDRWRLAKAYRALRWTWRVRDSAIEQAGPIGARLGLAVPVSIIASVVLAITFLVVLALTSPR